MFWSKDRNKPDKQEKPSNSKKGLQGNSGVRPEQGNSQRIREEALANARNARNLIGEESLDKIAAMMTKKQQSAMERAKRQINEKEAERVAEEILLMLDKR